MAYDSESEDIREVLMIPRGEHRGRFAKTMSIASSYDNTHNNQQPKQQNHRRSPMQCTESFWNSHLL